MIDISAVIPTYNRKDILLRTIKGLFEQTYPKDRFEIIIVDDGSDDGTEESVRAFHKLPQQFSHPSIIYLRQSPDKKGPAAANNLGIMNASGEYILLLNNDVIADSHLIEEHMKTHKICKSLRMQAPTKDFIVQGRVINTSSLEDLKKGHQGYSGGYSNISFGYFTTWNISVKKQLLIDAGLFDEDFRDLCWEDVEFGFRLRKMGIKQINNKDAFGYHFRHEFFMKDIDKIKDKSIKMGKNAMIYYRKHPCIEVKISTESFWLPMMIRCVLALSISLIGKKRIYDYMKALEKRKKLRMLAFLVGLAGKYWYLSGIRSRLHS